MNINRMSKISVGAQEAMFHLELEVLVRKAKPFVALMVKSIEKAHFTEDPVDIFIKQVELKNMEIEDVRHLIAKALPHLNFTWFLTQVGLSQGLGLFSETFKRMEERILPPLEHYTEVTWLVNKLFTADDLETIEKLKPAQLYKLLRFFNKQDNDISPLLLQHVQKSAEILAQRIAGLGLDTLIARKLIFREDLSHHFIDMGRWNFAEDSTRAVQTSITTINGCEETLQYIQARREEEGTSLALTYRIFLMEDLLRRLKDLVAIIKTSSPADFAKSLAQCSINICKLHKQRIKIRDFFTRNIEILAYQVTLLTGRTGEHYISSNSDELKKMWKKAIKGAFIVSIMVIIKIIMSKLPLAPLPQAFMYGSLWDLSFSMRWVVCLRRSSLP